MTIPVNRPGERLRPVVAASAQSRTRPDTHILRFNAMNEAHEYLYTLACHASDVARHAGKEALRLWALAKTERDAWRMAQLEHPERRAWLPLMAMIALILLALDSAAAYFAAEALGGDQQVTILWAALFLVILGLLEGGLSWTADRNRTVFRVIATGLVGFAVLLALLRFDFFAAVGITFLGATIGAIVFTVCTVMFVAGGFAVLRHAETVGIWQARRRVQRAARQAASADARAARRVAERDRRVDAYLGRMRPTLLGQAAGAQTIEDKVRAHLLGDRA